jgi:succinoglycan biosynthesis protein ExoA
MPIEHDLGPLVVIPCLNEERHLPGLLAYLLDDVPDGTLIAVIDGGSTDGTLACAEAFAASHKTVRVLHNERRIQSAAVNLAVATLGGGRRWVIRIDAHLTYPPGYVSGLIARGESLDVDAVVVPMVTGAETSEWFQNVVASVQNTKLGTGGAAHRGSKTGRFIDHGHHALFKTAVFVGVGGYDESFSHNEDAEFDFRLVRGGGRIWLEPALTIIYHPRRSLRALCKQYLKYGEGRARTLQRHRMRLKLRQIAPLMILPALLLALLGAALSVWSGGWSLWLVLPSVLWIAATVSYGLMLAIAARKLRDVASGPIAMAMHLAWSCGFCRQLLLGPKPGAEPHPLTLTTMEHPFSAPRFQHHAPA